MFLEATRLFNAGKFPQALQAYDAILRKYPGHEPSTIQYAKTLYRLDRMPESYAMFARVNPQFLDPETSYEYGWSFYSNKHWDGALFAFRRVPPGHALYDLANYYGGISAMRLKRHAEAEELFEKAVVLPDKLAKTRGLYLKHVQSLKLLQEKQELAKERQAEKDKATGSGQTPGAPGDKAGAPAATTAAAAPAPAGHQGLEIVEKVARISRSSAQQLQDFHGFAERKARIDVTSFGFSFGHIVPLPMAASDDPTRQAAVAIQLALAAEERTTEGTEQRLIIEEDNADIARLITTAQPRRRSQSGTASIGPWIEIPLPSKIWASAGGRMEYRYPEFERVGRTGSREGRVQLGVKEASWDLATRVLFADFVGTDNEVVTSLTEGALIGKYNFPHKLRLDGSAGYKRFEYLTEGLEGPDGVTFATTELRQGLPLGISLRAMGGFEQQTNAIFNGIPTWNRVAADGVTTTGRLRMVVAPLPWISLTATQLWSMTKWDIQNPEATEAFERNRPDFVSTLTIQGDLLFPF